MDKFLYYCENCDKLFKLGNKGKKVKCTKCGARLKDLEITSTDYEALSPDEKEVLKMWNVVEDTQDDNDTAGAVPGASSGDIHAVGPESGSHIHGIADLISEPETDHGEEQISEDLHGIGGAVTGLEALFGGSDSDSDSDSDSSSLFARFTGSGTESSSTQESPQETFSGTEQGSSTGDNYGQDDTGLDSGADFDGDLDFFFENQDEGIRMTDSSGNDDPGSSGERKLDSGSDYGMDDDDFGALFDVGEDSSDNKADAGSSDNIGSTAKESYGSSESVSMSTNSSSGGSFSFFGSMGVDTGVTSRSASGSNSGSSFFDTGSSSSSGGSTGSSFFDAGSSSSGSGGSSGSSFFDTGSSSSGSGGGSGSSFFDGVGSSSGSSGSSGSSFFGGTGGGSGSSFFDGVGSEPLYDNMSGSSSGTYVEKPAVTGGTMYSGPKSTPASSFSSGNGDDDAAMKMLNILSWVFCLAPFIMGIINAILSKTGVQIGGAVSIAVYVVIMALDSNYMRQFGAEVGFGWKLLGVLLFPPAYLFKKANAIGQKKTAAYVSLVTWLLSLVLIFLVMAAVFTAMSFM